MLSLQSNRDDCLGMGHGKCRRVVGAKVSRIGDTNIKTS